MSPVGAHMIIDRAEMSAAQLQPSPPDKLFPFRSVLFLFNTVHTRLAMLTADRERHRKPLAYDDEDYL